MRVAGIILCLLGALQPLSSQATPEIRLSGVVLDATTNQPLSGVKVRLSGLQVLSDSKGMFSFDKVPTGRHVLLADKTGYLRARPEGRKLGEGGIHLTLLGDAKSTNINLRMLQAGAVSGRVLDGQGAPLQNVLVMPYRFTYDDDGRQTLRRVTLNTRSVSSSRETDVSTELRRSLGLGPGEGDYTGVSDNSNVQPGRSNDLGEFRISDLDPGKYAFYIIPANPRNSTSIDRSHVPLFYPGVIRQEDAEVVEIETGAEIQLRTVSLSGRGPTTAVKLRLIDETGFALVGRPVFQIRTKGSPESILQSDFWSASAETCAKVPVACYVPSLPVGSYVVESFVSGAGRIAVTQTPLEMTGSDVEMDIHVSAGTKVTGRVISERASGPPTPVGGVRINLSAESVVPNIQFTMTSDSGGTMSMPSMPPSIYRLRDIFGIPVGMCLDEIREGDRNVMRDGLDVSRNDVTFSVRIGRSQTSVRGTVTDAGGKKIEDSVVVLVPDDGALTEAYVRSSTDQDGVFELTCIRPGTYHLYAWLELEGSAYRNPEFMKKFEEHGEPIRVGTGELVPVALKLSDGQ